MASAGGDTIVVVEEEEEGGAEETLEEVKATPTNEVNNIKSRSKHSNNTMIHDVCCLIVAVSIPLKILCTYSLYVENLFRPVDWIFRIRTRYLLDLSIFAYCSSYRFCLSRQYYSVVTHVRILRTVCIQWR